MAITKKIVWLLCGIPGSGKSTWIEQNKLPNSVVVSRDEIRFSIITDKDDYFGHEDEVWRRYVKKAQMAILNHDVENIYLDATHINEASRNKILNLLVSPNLPYFEIRIIYFDVCFAICCEGNAQRTGLANVPIKAIRRMFNNFVIPTFNEKHLYTEIWRVDAQGNIEKEININVCCCPV